jgi:hypothetical protein
LINRHLLPNEVNADKQQVRPEQPGWRDRVVRETQRTQLIDDQRADQLPGDDASAKRRVVPKRPTKSTGASTLNAPSRPPDQTHQGVPLNCAAAGHFERTANWKSNRLAADTKADNIEAQSGAPPACSAKLRLTAAWTTNEPPIRKAKKRRTRCIGRQLRRAKEIKQATLADKPSFFSRL